MKTELREEGKLPEEDKRDEIMPGCILVATFVQTGKSK